MARGMTGLNPEGELCVRCGKVAVGYARINDDRYCHGDNQRPSCYELACRSVLASSYIVIPTERDPIPALPPLDPEIGAPPAP